MTRDPFISFTDPAEYRAVREAVCRPALWVAVAIIEAWTVFALGTSPASMIIGLFGLLLVLLSLIDLRHMMLPDILTVPGIVAGLLLAPLMLGLPWWASAGGATAGFALFWLVSWGFEKLRGYPGLGYGDIKLMALLGAWAGLGALPLILLLGSLLGLAGFAVRRVVAGTATSQPLPFGPFLAAGAWLVMFYGSDIWAAIAAGRAAIVNAILGA